ncbi:hypothetical protein QOZ80_5BG0421300 [Eleusine coracana subsp. coracana]|nr:hypothetical protein QOZ80_5BG0421300 [Eleusine coracana subsp. coracana]
MRPSRLWPWCTGPPARILVRALFQAIDYAHSRWKNEERHGIPLTAAIPSRTTSVASSSGRRFASAPDSTAVADWLPDGGLSLGFNAGAARGNSSSLAAELWAGSPASRQAPAAALGYGAALNAAAAAGDVGMILVSPAYQRAAAAAAAAEDPTFPIVAAAQRAFDANANKPSAPGPAIQFWQQTPPAPPQPPAAAAAEESSPVKKKPLAMLDPGGARAADSGGSGSGGGASCYDCGNQAKKGCAHNRCRTCCNSRGFECDTHVKSTWVPASRRRERHHQIAGGSPPSLAAKKPRLACQTTNTATGNSCTSTSNATTPRGSFETSSSHHHQDASFKESLPRQVRGPAVFRCVQVTSVDDGQREVAYQAAVTINGHLFRGLLYDLGEDTRITSAAAQLGSSDLHLGSASGAADLDHYGGGGGGGPLILGGLGYGNTP